MPRSFFRLLELDVLAFEASRHTTTTVFYRHAQRSRADDALAGARCRHQACPPLRTPLHPSPGLAESVSGATAAADVAARGLWQGDPAVWSRDAAAQEEIAERLGWMTSPLLMADSIERLRTFAGSIKRNGFTDVVLLGMGGSSLAPEVLRAVIGVAPGWPRLHMLDSTDPAAVRSVATPEERTLYLLASKSGTTIEAEFARGPLPPALAGRRHSALGGSFRRHHRRRDGGSNGGRARSIFATCSSTRQTSADAIPRCPSSAWCRPR